MKICPLFKTPANGKIIDEVTDMLENILIILVDIGVVIFGGVKLYQYIKTKGKSFNNRL